ncbi:MAG: GNAT family N-acetyltransferase [Thermoleophilia bacterium]|nr:GNAT family N-acetyltransferase [Thermoleophilia bacterium]
MSDAIVVVPPSLDLLDVAGNGMDCERFLWIRGLSDPELAPKARIDLIDLLHRFPGELLYVASRDGRMAAKLMTLGDGSGDGGCFLSIHCREDPGEPLLGDLIDLACDRSRRAGVRGLRCGGVLDRSRPMQALVERHGFVEHERWRRFHADVDPEAAVPTLPDGLHASTLAERPDLTDGMFRVFREGLADTPGDFPRPDETLDEWLRDIDGSPILGRDLLLVLHDDDDHVLAMVELERLAAGSDRAWVEFLAVDRERRGEGLAAHAKRQAVALAGRVGLRRLQTMNHESNEPVCRLNERLGWVEDPVRISLRRNVDPAG